MCMYLWKENEDDRENIAFTPNNTSLLPTSSPFLFPFLQLFPLSSCINFPDSSAHNRLTIPFLVRLLPFLDLLFVLLTLIFPSSSGASELHSPLTTLLKPEGKSYGYNVENNPDPYTVLLFAKEARKTVEALQHTRPNKDTLTTETYHRWTRHTLAVTMPTMLRPQTIQ